MGELSEQNRALIEREIGSYTDLDWNKSFHFGPQTLNDLLDAARTEGRGDEPAGVDDKPAVRGDYRSTFQPPPISQIRFGPLLRQARGGLSLSKAAAKIGCTKAHLWEMEMGRSRNPTVQTLAGIASAYGLTVSYLAVIAAASLTNAAAPAAHAAPVAPQPRDEPLLPTPDNTNPKAGAPEHG